MKKILLSTLFIFSILSLSIGQELSKEEKKEWAKKLKSITVEDYKSLTESEENSRNSANELKGEVSNLNADNARLQQELDALKKKVKTAETKTAEAEAKLAECGSAPKELTEEQKSTAANAGEYNSAESATQKANTKGLVYRVQIGAYKGFDLTKYINNHPNFSGETGEDGLMRYTIGQFVEYWEADAFKKYLRDMGVQGAWVVAYKNGTRIQVKDALEGSH